MYKLLTYALKPGKSNIKLRIKDRFLGWYHLNRTGEHHSEYLYALNGQSDSEGSENHIVYAAFNRVIGTDSRSGNGVGKVTVTLMPHPVEIPTVTSATGKVWMDRNLGASRVAQSYNDAEAYGDLYQWGRLKDGHEQRDPLSGTVGTQSSDDDPLHDDFIIGFNDWRSPLNNDLWQGSGGTNNPCPVGFRLPSASEWLAEIKEYGDYEFSQFQTPLKLVVAGYRDPADGVVIAPTISHEYWSRLSKFRLIRIIFPRFLDFSPD